MQKKEVKEAIEEIQFHMAKAKGIIIYFRKSSIKHLQKEPIEKFRLPKKELKELNILFENVIKISNKLLDNLKNDKELSDIFKKSAMDLAATERELSIRLLSKTDSLDVLMGGEAADKLEEIYELTKVMG
ncbi:MAG: hypothetical protein Q8R00_03600 [Candidatus Nanoarchaeia archaeon]|nr:hypothetical protein [Candidatus Nanoarchaeia archaeon]